jgi:hypothetical protein
MRRDTYLKYLHSDKNTGLTAEENNPGAFTIVRVYSVYSEGSPSSPSGFAVRVAPLESVAEPCGLHGCR